MSIKTEKKKNNVALTVLILTLIILIAGVLSIITFVNLNKKDADSKKYTASFVTKEVAKKMSYDNLSEISSSGINKYYDIPDGIVADSSMYISTRSDNFNEIACFRLTDETKQEELIKIIEKYINDKKLTYQNVNEKAYSIANAAKTEVSYPYVFVAISSDSDAAINAFRSIVDSSSSDKKKIGQK